MNAAISGIPTASQIRERLNAKGASARCPAHEDTNASLSIGTGENDKPLLKCHAGCSQSAVIEALQDLGIWPRAMGATVSGLAVAKHLPHSLLVDSGFADDVTSGGTPIVRIDYRGADGKISCVRYRGAVDKSSEGPRFWFRKGDKQQLFGMWRLRPEEVIVVEGETDAVALWAAGFNAIGVPGADAWREDRFVRELARCPTIYVHVEPDVGGVKFRAAFERSSLHSRVRFFTVPGAKDPCELHSRDPKGFSEKINAAIRDARPSTAHDAVKETAATGQTPMILPLVTDGGTNARADADGAALISDVRTFIKRFCAFPDEHALNAATLWVAHAHAVEHFHTTPRFALISPEPGSGKTRVLEVLDLLVPESMFCLSASPAAIFRTLAKSPITLLVDECDAIFSRRGKDDANEDLRALLNAGYKRGATIPRCVGPKHDVQNFQVYCATALAGLGDLPDTIMTRSVIIRMRRRGPSEHVDPFRTREHSSEGHAIRDRLVRWSAIIGPVAGKAWPLLPEGIVDRPAEVWEPLIAMGDAAGGEWPRRAREACLSLVKASQENRVSLGVRLLADVRTIFTKANNPEALHTETILERLCGGASYGLDDDAPWRDLHGKPLAVRGLASMLKRYAVSSIKVKVDGRSLQGYRREQLWDAWSRYLPPVLAQAESVEPAVLSEPESVILVPEVPEVPQVLGSESAFNGHAEVF